ncbi:MAG: hypothetical protein AAB776_00690 [Patescibacteria group bacterium]
MTTATHTAIGVLIGTAVGNPILGFVLGVASHYLVDMIPHGDMHMRDSNNLVNKTNERMSHVFVIVDIALGITLLNILGTFLPDDVTRSSVYIASIFGSILPDLLVGINDLVKSLPGRKHTRLHFYFHDFFCRKHGDTKLRYSLAVQALFVVAVVCFLY